MMMMLQEYRRRQIEDWFYNIKLTPKQREFSNKTQLYNFLAGGNRSGKTVVGAYLTCMHASGQYPDWYEGRKYDSPVNIWAIGLSEEVSIEIQQAMIYKMLPKNWIDYGKYDPVSGWTNNKIRLKNGSTITFKWASKGRDKFQGAAVHMAWFDEDPMDEGVFKEVKMRTTDHKGHIMVTFTPVETKPGFISRMYKKYQRGSKHITFTSISTYDNKQNLEEGTIERLEADMDSESEKKRRLEGIFCFDDAKAVFRVSRLSEMLDSPTSTVKDGLKIFSEPVDGSDGRQPHAYLLGVDGSENVNDSNAVIVWDRHEQREALTWRGQKDPDKIADDIIQWGTAYNNALAVVEAASGGLSILEFLKYKKYRHIFQRETYNRKDKRVTKKLGWKTGQNKKILEGWYNRALRDDEFYVNDDRIIVESMNYVRNEKGKTGAIPPDTDDMVIALMLCIWYHNTHNLRVRKSIPKSRVQRQAWYATMRGSSRRTGEFN